MGHAEDRRLDVLRAIVADFVSSKEPIGSKTLVERHNLGVSSATVRNDMAVLEAGGYITQPHTSSGRAPTVKGYREFVDRLDDIKLPSSSERPAILSFLAAGVARVRGGAATGRAHSADVGGSPRSVLDAREEQVVGLRLLAAHQEAGKATVRIGHETEAEQMAGTSVVSTAYGSLGKVYGGM